MARKFLIGTIVLSLLAGIGMFVIGIMVNQASWKKVSEADCPDGTFTVFQYNYFLDGNRHAPYGKYLFIKPSSSHKKPINSYVIFAGYCTNDKLYKWASNTELDITCIESENNSVKTLSKKAYGINISAVVENPKKS